MKTFYEKFNTKKELINFAKKCENRFVKSAVVQILNKGSEEKYGDSYHLSCEERDQGCFVYASKFVRNKIGQYFEKEILIIY